MHILFLELFNLFFAGILAGLEFTVHYGFQSATVALDEKPQIQMRQGVIRKLRVLVPIIFAFTILSGIAVTFQEGIAPGSFFRYASLFVNQTRNVLVLS